MNIGEQILREAPDLGTGNEEWEENRRAFWRMQYDLWTAMRKLRFCSNGFGRSSAMFLSTSNKFCPKVCQFTKFGDFEGDSP